MIDCIFLDGDQLFVWKLYVEWYFKVVVINSWCKIQWFLVEIFVEWDFVECVVFCDVRKDVVDMFQLVFIFEGLDFIFFFVNFFF